MTLRQAVADAQAQLAAVPDLAPTAPQDAALLVLGTLHLPRTALYTAPTRPLSPREHLRLTAALHRRLRGEPIQYILGTQEFFGLPLAVSPAVLIPRPETELLVEAALHRLPPDQPLLLADIGTGSGAIALALATHLPLARVLALDLSPAALDLAARNARALGVADRVTFLHSDLLVALPPGTPPLDAILANPPYIPSADAPTLHRQVRDFEPHLALFAPLEPAPTEPDGLSLYRRLLPQALAALRPGGLLALEFGAGQQPALARLLTPWNDPLFLPDLQGIPRVALARRP